MIPKIHHTVWTSGDEFKEKYFNYRLSWMKHNPDWDFIFWTINDFIANGLYVPTVCDRVITSDLVDHVYKSDIIRMLVINGLGGIYSDPDVECLKSFDQLLDKKYFAAQCITPGIATNAIFGSEPCNQSLVNIAITIAETLLSDSRAAKKYSCKYGANIAGKMMLDFPVIYKAKYFNPFGNHNEQYRNRDDLNIVFPDSYCVHHWTGQDRDGD